MNSHIIKLTMFSAGLLVPVVVSAQSGNPFGTFLAALWLTDLVLVLGVVVLIAAFYSILKVLGMLLKLEEIRMLREKGLEEVADHYRQPEESYLSKMWKRMQGTVPLSKEEDILFDHEYDGIRELDNKLPPWWVGMFYITIAIAAVYLYVYHVSDIGLSSAQKYEVEMETAKKEVEAYLATRADNIDESNVELATDPADIAAGQEIYMAQCVVCHGPSGEGGVGPNFTDKYWIHGGDIKDLFRTIKYGVPEKGMISWSSQLRPSQMQQVASYILTMQGTNPPNGKAPEGELYEPPAPAEAMLQDSTAVGD